MKNVLSVGNSLFIGLLSSTLSRLNELGEQGRRLSGSTMDEAVSLIIELKRLGFKNRDITVMTGRRWSEATVKKYTKGVKIVSTVERDKVLETFSAFVREGKTIQEVDDYLEMDKYLNSLGLIFEDVGIMISKTHETRSLQLLVDLYSQIAESKYSVRDISAGLNILQKLDEKTVTIQALTDLNEIVDTYGGLSKFIQLIEKYKSLMEIQQEIRLAEGEVNKQIQMYTYMEAEYKKLEAKSLIFVSLFGFTKALVKEHNFDLASTKTLFDVAEKYGTPIEILEAILSYQNLQELQKQRETVKSEISLIKDKKIRKEAELAAIEIFIEKANRSIGIIEANHSKSLTIQAIVDLIYETGESIDPVRFKKIVFLFLVGIQSYIKKMGTIPGWDPLLNIRISTLVSRLSTLM